MIVVEFRRFRVVVFQAVWGRSGGSGVLTPLRGAAASHVGNKASKKNVTKSFLRQK
jgi:hypothetical protein